VLLPANVTSPDPGIATGGATATDPAPSTVSNYLLGRLTPGTTEERLLPPLYGAMQAGVRQSQLAPPTGGSGPMLPTWLDELNTDPRLRAFAGLGAQVVQSEQQQLLAAAWDQVHDATQVNSLLTRAQLARSVAAAQAARHLSGQSPLGLLQLIGPQTTRTVAPNGQSLAATAAQDPISRSMLSAPFRRLARPRGPYGSMPRRPAPSVALGTNDVLGALAPATSVERRVAQEHLSDYARAATLPMRKARAPMPGNRPTAMTTTRSDPLRELTVTVSFPAGMVQPLLNLAPDAVLAGIEGIPQNTALTLQTNPSVIAAYMVAINHEVNRELAWHQVPIDRRGTPFRYFWDSRGQSEAQPDLDADIAGWASTSSLESHVSGGSAQLVLAVRAELLRRYPRTSVYALAAVEQSDGTHTLADESVAANVIAASFTALLPPDLRLFFFALDPKVAIGEPGWFFVFQEQVSETRFGRQDQAPGSHWSVPQLGLTTSIPHAGDVAGGTRLVPVRCAIHARALLPEARG
jgi:hypothetical protein